ncbi:MAG TPA: response regulator [Leptolyngbyaceae cyanobacterium]
MASPGTDKPCILAVDDSPIIQKMIQEALQSDYRILVTGKPMEVLTLIYHEPISLLLLDVTMPEIDGLELCRTIRTIPQFHALPIIMITSKDTPFDRIQGRMAGANEYVTKPFDPQQLKQVIQPLLANPTARR